MLTYLPIWAGLDFRKWWEPVVNSGLNRFLKRGVKLGNLAFQLLVDFVLNVADTRVFTLKQLDTIKNTIT